MYGTTHGSQGRMDSVFVHEDKVNLMSESLAMSFLSLYVMYFHAIKAYLILDF